MSIDIEADSTIAPDEQAEKTSRTQFMQQFEGINIMSYYLLSVVIEQVGLSNNAARLVNGINAITYLVFSSVVIPLVERWVRHRLMFISTAGQDLAFLVICILLKRLGSVPVACAAMCL